MRNPPLDSGISAVRWSGVIALVACIQVARPVVGAEPSLPTQIAVVFNDYMLGPDTVTVTNGLLAAHPQTSGLQVYNFGLDAHACATAAGPTGHLAKYELWKVFAREKKFAGMGKKLRKLAAVEDLPWRALILEVKFRLAAKHGTSAEEYFEEAVTNLAPQIAGARKAGIPVWLYMIPDKLHTKGYRGRGGNQTWNATNIAERVAFLDGVRDRLHERLDVPVLPGYAPFAILRRDHPEIELHGPCKDLDTHLSPRDSYVVGCLFATALAGERLPPPADLSGFFTRSEKSAAYRAKKAKCEPPPPITIPAAWLTAIHEAVWQTVQKAELGQGNDGGKEERK